jgi:UDP-N-acetylglucosamine 2-epimerase (non-hydrolysing)
MKQKILLVFGTRPEAIKMAPLVKALKRQPEKFITLVCVTGQHREMLDQVLRIFEITPDYDLNIMKAGQDLYDVTSRVLTGMREVLSKEKPDMVLVHGDTTTSTATALAAFYQQIPVGHVEAGLRTHNIYSPWPEEMNRQITGRIATVHFAPTPLSRDNLIREGVKKEIIKVTGNTVIDALQMVIEKIKTIKGIENELLKKIAGYGLSESLIAKWGKERRLILITGHRRENFGDGFLHICHAIRELALNYPEADFVYPVHLNPNVKTPVFDILGNDEYEMLANVHLVAPFDYLPFVYLMNKSFLVLTDSGGIQEEAPGLGKPVLVMRETTERPEALEAGTVLLVGTDKQKIVQEVSHLLDDKAHYHAMSQATNPYGDGKASERITDFILKYSQKEETLLMVHSQT